MFFLGCFFFCISNFAGWWSHFVFSLSWLLGLSQSPTLKSLSVTKTKEEMELVSAEGNVYISLKKRPAMPWHAMCMSAHQYLNRRSLNRAKGSGLINDSLIQSSQVEQLQPHKAGIHQRARVVVCKETADEEEWTKGQLSNRQGSSQKLRNLKFEAHP